VEPVQPQDAKPSRAPRRRAAPSGSDAAQGAEAVMPTTRPDAPAQLPPTNKPAGPEGNA